MRRKIVLLILTAAWAENDSERGPDEDSW